MAASRVIGKGGFGTITLIDEHTVLKRIPIKSEKIRDVVILGINTIRTIEHKNILNVRDARNIVDSSGYLVYIDVYMEYVNGVTLNKYKPQGKNRMLKIFNVFYQIADALEFLHSNGIVHRDIKMANILVKNDIPFLIDYDFVCQPLKNCSGLSGTKTNLDPLLLINEITPESYFLGDVYSFIVVMYRVLNIIPPWDRKMGDELMEDKKKGIFEPISTDYDELDNMINRGLSINPEDRYSITQIKEKLSMLIKDII